MIGRLCEEKVSSALCPRKCPPGQEHSSDVYARAKNSPRLPSRTRFTFSSASTSQYNAAPTHEQQRKRAYVYGPLQDRRDPHFRHRRADEVARRENMQRDEAALKAPDPGVCSTACCACRGDGVRRARAGSGWAGGGVSSSRVDASSGEWGGLRARSLRRETPSESN